MKRENVLVVGAGEVGELIAREVATTFKEKYSIVGFVDDDKKKIGKQVRDISVLGPTSEIAQLVEKHDVDYIMIAIATAYGSALRKIVAACEKAGVPYKLIPNVYELMAGSVLVSQMRPVKVEDLLNREPVKLDAKGLSKEVKGKTILVTGAGGSIGSEICQQLCEFKPKKLLLLGHGENSIYETDNELRLKFPGIDVVPVIADVVDEKKIGRVFETYKPDIVFHAAAHKHVPLMEMYPEEAVKNNVLGTHALANAAKAHGCSLFVFISSDKAVNPTSVMGATKRVGEMIAQSMANGTTRFIAVRFGNVLGSRGSVIPLFRKQIESGGPVTVTDKRMVRYFMTIPEAAQLVLQTTLVGKSGDVMVLDMGEQVNIAELAKQMILLSGFEPGKEIEIKYTGMRPGEKLYEEIMTAAEGIKSTSHDQIFTASLPKVEQAELNASISRLEKSAADGDTKAITEELRRLVPEFKQA
ncbi:polysaccharide biosynthesis protein [archaeon]